MGWDVLEKDMHWLCRIWPSERLGHDVLSLPCSVFSDNLETIMDATCGDAERFAETQWDKMKTRVIKIETRITESEP